MTWFYLDDEEIRCESGLWRFAGRAADKRDPTAKKLRLQIFAFLISKGGCLIDVEQRVVKYVVCADRDLVVCDTSEGWDVLAERIHSETRANRPSSMDRDEPASPTSELDALDKMQHLLDHLKAKAEERDDYSDIARDAWYE